MAEPLVLLPTEIKPGHVESWASLSADKRHRYSLGRRWRVGPMVLFAGLNPSDADDLVDDPTCRKWRGFATRWGFGGFMAGNLCAFRTPYPTELVGMINRGERLACVGERNDAHLEHLANHPNVTLIVPCWGSSIPPELRYRVDDVVALLRASGRPLKCLGLTKGGDPRHPARLGYGTPLVPFEVSNG
jgi:hypothetical protein